MENTQPALTSPGLEFSQEIDGRIYTVRAFFKDSGESLQQMIERMIKRELLTFTQKNAMESA